MSARSAATAFCAAVSFGYCSSDPTIRLRLVRLPSAWTLQSPVPQELSQSQVEWNRFTRSVGLAVTHVLHTQLLRTGYSPVRTAEENCRTDQVRSTRRTWNRRQKKSESW